MSKIIKKLRDVIYGRLRMLSTTYRDNKSRSRFTKKYTLKPSTLNVLIFVVEFVYEILCEMKKSTFDEMKANWLCEMIVFLELNGMKRSTIFNIYCKMVK